MNSCVYKKLGAFSVISGEDGQITDPNIVGKNIIVRVVGGSIVRNGASYGTYPSNITIDNKTGHIRWKGIPLDGLSYWEGEDKRYMISEKMCVIYEYGWF